MYANRDEIALPLPRWIATRSAGHKPAYPSVREIKTGPQMEAIELATEYEKALDQLANNHASDFERQRALVAELKAQIKSDEEAFEQRLAALEAENRSLVKENANQKTLIDHYEGHVADMAQVRVRLEHWQAQHQDEQQTQPQQDGQQS